VITAAALTLIARTPPQGGAAWLGGASALQGFGVGLLFTPLSTLAFSTLSEALRTDGAGVYSLIRQLGCASGVSALTAVLQMRIRAHTGPVGVGPETEVLQAYSECFRIMAIATVALVPGVFAFRNLGPPQAAPEQA
jgi:hypothetical protein